MQVPTDVIRNSLSTLGVEFRTKSECGLRIVIRAELFPSASAVLAPLPPRIVIVKLLAYPRLVWQFAD